MTMVRQWNSLSLDCDTTRSTTSIWGTDLSQRVTVSPSSSRSRALVAEKTFTPVNCIALSTAPLTPPPKKREGASKYRRRAPRCQTGPDPSRGYRDGNIDSFKKGGRGAKRADAPP